LQFAVIILGAGRSSRMGQPKLLLPWGDETIAGYSVRQWTAAGAASICVVVAAADTGLINEVRKSGAFDITNPDPDRGMFSSVRCAAEWPHWDATLTHWIISLGDQPHLLGTTLRQLLGAVQSDPASVWQPVYGGRRRHPVVLPKNSFVALRDTTAPDLKAFLESSRRSSVEIDDPGLEIDIDTPEDYARAKKL
jgi:molybdenum cofactor cytidylyltransferase